jgi:hypothetical protein
VIGLTNLTEWTTTQLQADVHFTLGIFQQNSQVQPDRYAKKAKCAVVCFSSVERVDMVNIWPYLLSAAELHWKKEQFEESAKSSDNAK